MLNDEQVNRVQKPIRIKIAVRMRPLNFEESQHMEYFEGQNLQIFPDENKV